MKKLSIFSIFFIIIISFPSRQATAQVSSHDSLMVANKSMIDVISLIETKHQLKFKYKEEWLDDITINKNIKYSTVEQLLDILLASTNLSYFFRDPNYIVLLKNNPAQINFDDKGQDEPNQQIIALGSISMDQTEAVLSGKIISGDDLRPITAATVQVDNKYTAVTNDLGYYQINLPVGIHEIKINSLETKAINLEVNLFSSAELNLSLYKDFEQLEDVIVTAKRLDENVKETMAGKENMSIEEIEKIPAFLGEPDVIRSILSLPGVNTTGEASSGFNARGIGAGNNLILADQGIIFNSSHMLGVFTAFNSGAVKSVDFYKGTVPAKYGGRIGAVLDVEFKTASKERFSGKGGIGIMASNLNLDVPVVKKKSSLQLGLRVAYPNYLRVFIAGSDLQNSSAFFADGQLKYVHDINENNQLLFSTYSSTDDFNFANELQYNYDQLLSTLSWKHFYSDQLFSTISLNHSGYNSNLTTLNNEGQIEEVLYTTIDVNQLNLDFSWDKFDRHQVEFGLNNKYYNLQPRNFESVTGDTVNLASEAALESAIYVSDNFEVSDRISIYGGLRFNTYFSQLDTLNKNYYGIDPRLSINFSLNGSSSIKVAYNRSRQFLQLITNTTSISPVDTRKLANSSIKPSISDQVSIGIFKNFFNNNIETSIEFYKGLVTNAIDFKNGADLTRSSEIESSLLQGVGDNYGVEFYLKKNRGNLTGWLSYTYSRAFTKIEGNTTATSINLGEAYPSNYDQPHVLNLMANYQFTRRVDLSFNFVYNTGRPATYPIGVYSAFGLSVADYSNRNNFRIPDYHRLDLSLHIAPPLKRYKKIMGSWTLTLYNVYGRKNAYSIFYRPSETLYRLESYRLSVIGNIVPAITYNFKF